MALRTLFVLAVAVSTGVAGVSASVQPPKEPLLRLRLEPDFPAPTQTVKLRLRTPISTPQTESMHITLQDNGPVGKVANVPVPQSNLHLVIGSATDLSEQGRIADRALAAELFDHANDRTPFLGLGYRASDLGQGFSFDTSFGANFYDRPDPSRLGMASRERISDDEQVKLRANLRLRYTF